MIYRTSEIYESISVHSESLVLYARYYTRFVPDAGTDVLSDVSTILLRLVNNNHIELPPKGRK